jgi:CCR4-NOT transcription complex subunit 2
MSNILYIYLKELKDDSIKNISNTIMNNFILYKQKMINRKLRTVFNLYKSKEQLNLSKKFSQWNKNLLNDKVNSNNNNYFNLNLNVGPIINNNNNNGTNIEKKIKNKHIRNNINNSNTFHNSNSLPNMSSNSLNQKNKKRPISSEDSNKTNKNLNLKKNKSVLSINKNLEEKILMQKMKRNKNSSEKIDKFIKRQEIFSKNNFHKKEKIIKDNEDENKLIYTFEPKINDSLRKLYKNDNVSVGKRLYNDSIIRRNKQLEKEYTKSNICNNMNKKVYNQKKIIELYEDYNLRREKNKELIKKIEKECGYTYVPSIMHKKNSGFSTNKISNVQYNTSKNKNNNKKKINKDININNKKLKKNNSCSESFRVIKNK